MRCDLCFHHCEIDEGKRGFCLSRGNKNGKIVPLNYGEITSLALDPIEKKPLRRFYPHSLILSVGSYGCNLKCPFCQNHEISYDTGKEVYMHLTPRELVHQALRFKPQGNIGIAFTYNEPFVSFEYMYETFVLAKKQDLKTVIVTNGTIEKPYLEKILPYVDAMNIDLKGFRQEIYETLSGDLETVKQCIEMSYPKTHVEVTTLIVPMLNDSYLDMGKEATYLASLSPDLPLHITRAFGRYKMTTFQATDLAVINRMYGIAKESLHYVYKGNV